MQALPIVLQEQSCLLIGPHGCGKTLAYILPTLVRVLGQELAMPWDKDEAPFAVIVT